MNTVTHFPHETNSITDRKAVRCPISESQSSRTSAAIHLSTDEHAMSLRWDVWLTRRWLDGDKHRFRIDIVCHRTKIVNVRHQSKVSDNISLLADHIPVHLNVISIDGWVLKTCSSFRCSRISNTKRKERHTVLHPAACIARWLHSTWSDCILLRWVWTYYDPVDLYETMSQWIVMQHMKDAIVQYPWTLTVLLRGYIIGDEQQTLKCSTALNGKIDGRYTIVLAVATGPDSKKYKSVALSLKWKEKLA